MEIKSQYKPVVAVDNSKFTPDRLTQIPNMAICEIEYARKIDDPCINMILDAFELTGIDISECTITTRTYDLKEGDSTHPLDWHCDGHNPGDSIDHDPEGFVQYIGHVGPNEIPFEIVDDIVVTEDIVYSGRDSYDPVAELINSNNYNIERLPVGQFADIGATVIHRVTPAIDNGMRTLVIISNVHKFVPILNDNKNKIRDDVKVY